MTEQELKETLKYVLDNGQRKITKEEKEIIKVGIDKAENLGQLLQVAISCLLIDANR